MKKLNFQKKIFANICGKSICLKANWLNQEDAFTLNERNVTMEVFARIMKTSDAFQTYRNVKDRTACWKSVELGLAARCRVS